MSNGGERHRGWRIRPQMGAVRDSAVGDSTVGDSAVGDSAVRDSAVGDSAVGGDSFFFGSASTHIVFSEYVVISIHVVDQLTIGAVDHGARALSIVVWPARRLGLVPFSVVVVEASDGLRVEVLRHQIIVLWRRLDEPLLDHIEETASRVEEMGLKKWGRRNGVEAMGLKQWR